MATSENDPLARELDRQDTYLRHYHMQRVAILPDKNCLFSAVCKAGNLHMDWYDLRIETAGYIAGHMNDFHTFMSDKQHATLLDNMSDIAEELQMMKEGESWVGYETIMALSRHLGAVILVTSGGTSAHDNIGTASFYFGEDRPDKRIHLVWVSRGFYDAVVPASGSDGGQNVVHRRPVKTELLPRNGRHPSHCCDCDWSCDCRRWRDTYTFPEETVQPSLVNSPPTQSSSEKQKWDKVFTYLRKEAFVLQKWKFIMRWLNVDEATITRIDRDRSPLDEKVFDAFDSWRQSNEACTLQSIQEALREENLILVAEGLNQFK